MKKVVCLLAVLLTACSESSAPDNYGRLVLQNKSSLTIPRLYFAQCVPDYTWGKNWVDGDPIPSQGQRTFALPEGCWHTRIESLQYRLTFDFTIRRGETTEQVVTD